MGTRTRRPFQDQTHRLPAGTVEMMVARQKGRCLICGDELRPGKFVVDHDHLLAARDGHAPEHGCPQCVRGLLDAKCNGLLGFAQDDPGRLERAAAYIRLARGEA